MVKNRKRYSLILRAVVIIFFLIALIVQVSCAQKSNSKNTAATDVNTIKPPNNNLKYEALWKHYLSGDYKNIIEKADSLLDNNPDDIDLNLLLGRTYTDVGEYPKAIQFLEYTVENDSSNSWRKAWAQAYLGTCYFMTNEYSKSKQILLECIKLNATKNVNRYVRRSFALFGFHNSYDNWKTIETDHFRFYIQDFYESEIQEYISSREATFKSINSFFNSTIPKKIDFFVWKSREDAKKILQRDLGFANSIYCIVHSHYQQTKGHEMTHVISYFTTDINFGTQFINEGTSVAFDQVHSDDKKQLVKKWKKWNNKKVNIKDIWTNFRSYPEMFSYPLSGLFVRELIEKFGKDKFLTFFKNQSYDNAQKVFGSELNIFIEEFENKFND